MSLSAFVRCCLLLTLFLAGAVALKAQTNINGVINTYKKITYIDPTKTRLGVPTASTGFAAGDRVLIIQMKGAAINTTNTSAYGSITGLNSAGYYEYNNVQGTTTDSIFLAGPLCRNYNTSDSVQIIRVPVYTGTVNVTGMLTAAPFNGSTGGVLVFEVNGTLNLQANIDVSDRGYRGGNVFGTSFLCANANFYTAQGAFTSEGKKGEGSAHYILTQECGRGKLAQGGGGAGSGNTGGGGGANIGTGGMGGKEYSGCATTVTNQSYGGEAIVPVPERAFMGGGGGGPQRDNGNTVYNGGNGGALILIKATTITGNSNVIRSNGQGITNVIADEGTSGGGAGGSIYLICNNFTTPLTIEAKGGVGGSNNNVSFASFCHGPGGGGGGGLIWFSTGATPAGITTTVTGGAAGTINNPSSSCYNTTYDATAGGAGSVKYNLVDGSYNPLNLRDTLVCSPSATITLDIGSGYSGVLWSTGATTNSINVGPGTYSVEATTPLGCLIRDTAVVKVDSMTLGNDTVICPGTNLSLSPKPAGNFTNYLWNTGAVSPSINTSVAGTFWVQVQTLAGCTFSDTIRVKVDSIPRMRDTVLCTDTFTVILSMPPGHQNYLWNTGATGNAIAVTTPGTYFVQVLSASNCVFIDTAIVTRDAVSIGPDTILCISQTPYYLVPQPSANFTSYLWNDGSSNDSLTVTKTGTYSVRVQTIYNCTLRDTVQVTVDSTPYLNIVLPDTVLCDGEPVLFRADVQQQGLTTLTWNFDDGTPEQQNVNPVLHSFDPDGIYRVSIRTDFRVCEDLVDTQEVIVHPYPSLNVGRDTTICLNGQALLLGDASIAADPDAHFRWNTGDTTGFITARHHGLFWATVTKNGCATTDSVQVFKDCYIDVPNVFTPNGDGTNDYFFPRQFLGRSVAKFKMIVYNRWGQIVFETTSPNGRGWDGKFNDEDQPQGVYIYLIEASFTNAASEKYQGNVTLLR